MAESEEDQNSLANYRRMLAGDAKSEKRQPEKKA